MKEIIDYNGRHTSAHKPTTHDDSEGLIWGLVYDYSEFSVKLNVSLVLVVFLSVCFCLYGSLTAYTGLSDRRVFVGDVVVLKDPEKSDNYLVRRLAAIEGYEMVSTDEKDEPFVLETDQCWVLSDNETLKAKVCCF